MDTAQPQTGTARVRGLDAARVIASLATVMYHAAISPELVRARECLRFAVSYFSLVAAYFLVSSLRRRPDRPFGPFAGAKFRRLYLPLLGWSGVYWCLGYVKTRIQHEPHLPLDWRVVLTGSNYVLWFLPYLLAAMLLAFPIVKFALRSRGREVAVAVALLVLGVVMSFLPMQGELDDLLDEAFGHNIETPWVVLKSWARAPSFMWGLGLALLWRPGASTTPEQPQSAGRAPAAVSLAGLALMIVCGAAAMMVGHVGAGDSGQQMVLGHMNVLDNLMGVGLFLIALGPTPLQNPGGLARLGSLTYGIYLAHEIFEMPIQALMKQKGIAPTVWTDVMVFLVAAVCSIGLTVVIRRIRWLRWMVP